MKSQNQCLAKAVCLPRGLLRFKETEKCDGGGICLCSVVVIYEGKGVSVCGFNCVYMDVREGRAVKCWPLALQAQVNSQIFKNVLITLTLIVLLCTTPAC